MNVRNTGRNSNRYCGWAHVEHARFIGWRCQNRDQQANNVARSSILRPRNARKRVTRFGTFQRCEPSGCYCMTVCHRLPSDVSYSTVPLFPSVAEDVSMSPWGGQKAEGCERIAVMRRNFRYDYNITPWEGVENLKREKRRKEVYAAMVDSMDQGIGRILTALKKQGVEKNTLVMFLSGQRRN